MTTVVRSNFIGNFKIGDNIHFNLEILALLYRHMHGAPSAEQNLLCKPIIVTIASIAEAILHDFHFRAIRFTREGIVNVPTSILDYIRNLKKIDKFGTYIVSVKRHQILGPETHAIYADLDFLRRLRNRMHIQNEKGDLEPNEAQAFNVSRLELAERALEYVMKTMAANHSRPNHPFGNDFTLPWPARVT